MKNVYALLVGINEYPPPIPKLGGCINDLNQIEAYLSQWAGAPESVAPQAGSLPVKRYGPASICRLENEKATYHNIIAAFRQFLRQAGPDDVAWFHYSGHGSEEFTAEEFLSLEPNGKDQTLVCYQQDAQRDGHLHLADKELAVLLHELATQDVHGQPKEAPHIVVSLDCCHSGSGTRDAEDVPLKSRNYDNLRAGSRHAAKNIRSLDTYVEGYYARQWEKQARLEVPVAPHVLLSACESIQKAGDRPGGGLFTTGLMEALKHAQGNISYADLFIRTRATVRRIVREYSREQDPQFETIGHFNPYTRFLEGTPLGTPFRFEVVREAGQWFVRCGAIHGLPMKAEQPIELEIQSGPPEHSALGKAWVEKAGAQKSRLVLAEGLTLDPEQAYFAVLHFLPTPPALVLLRGEAAPLDALKAVWDASRNIQWMSEEDQATLGEPRMEVRAEGGKYRIYDCQTERLVQALSQNPGAEKMAMDSLSKAVRWDRTLKLRNDRSGIRQWMEFELGVMDNSRQTTYYQEESLDLSTDNFIEKNGALFAGFVPRVKVKKKAQPLYFYLFHLRASYSIDCYEGELVFRPEEHPGPTEATLPLWKQPKGWGLSPGEPESTCYFMLLATTESLDYQQLLQAGIGAMRDVHFNWNPMAVSDDWCTISVKVRASRRE